MIRSATVQDVPAIANLINTFAQRGLMLFRSHAELYETLRDFVVFEGSRGQGVEGASEGVKGSRRPASLGVKESHPPLDPSTPRPLDPSVSTPSAAAPLDPLTPAVLGVCALEIVWADLAEVKSLAVDKSCQGRGIGRQLVEAVVAEARRLQIQRVFSLTYEQAFFAKLGFQVVDRAALPLKVWSDCMRCPKRLGCDEIAMVRTLRPAPAVEETDPNADVHLRYDVPTPITQLRTD